MSVRDTYPNGACPDCGEPIPDAGEGAACANCGHVFWEDTADEASVEIASPTPPLDVEDVVVTG